MVRKNVVYKQLANNMKEETLSKDRDLKQVERKMNHLQEKWREAHDWATGETGAGIKSANEGSWKDMF